MNNLNAHGRIVSRRCRLCGLKKNIGQFRRFAPAEPARSPLCNKCERVRAENERRIRGFGPR